MTIPFYDSGAGDQASEILSFVTDRMKESYAATYFHAQQILQAAQFDYDDYPRQTTEDINFCRSLDALQVLESLAITEPEWPTDVPTTVPDTPVLEPFEFFDDTSIPNFTGALDELNLPESPVVDAVSPPGAAPTVTYPITPTREQRTWPVLPTLAMPILPTPIVSTIPRFDESLSMEDLLTVTDNFTFQDGHYVSDLSTLLQTILTTAVEQRQFGLLAADDAGLAARSSQRDVGVRTWVQGPLAGFVQEFPSDVAGSLFTNTQNLSQQSGFLRGVELARSTAQRDDRKNVLEQSATFEDVQMRLADAVAVRALGAAKAEVLFMIDVYNATVAKYNALTKRFSALADVFAERIRAEASKVQLFRGMIDAEKEKVNFNKTLTQLYATQVQAVEEAVKAYNIDVEAARTVAQGEKLKIDVFKSQVEALVAQVRAKEYEAEAYKAKVKGEKAKVDAYAAQADAFETVMRGVQAAVESNRMKLKQFTEMNKDLLSVYQAKGTVIEENAAAYVDNNKAKTLKYGALVDVYAAELGGVDKLIALDIAAADKEYSSSIEAMNTNASIVEARMKEILSAADLRTDAATAYSGALRTLAAAAMSALNVTASLSSSTSSSLGYGYAYSLSDSEARSKSFTHSKADSESCSKSYNKSWADTVDSNTSYTVSDDIITSRRQDVAYTKNYNYTPPKEE